ncbi:hypothetical protein JX265_010503 [Neoarthrinium moseri]|uniref:Phosphotransferase n=1 Tax=Neoarthrinium moseri TaxID=1658444 RepID=A0A9P9WE41_9PEZI|nr:hypothetical protein JX265_010503 [Neoarthrinium moseri]
MSQASTETPGLLAQARIIAGDFEFSPEDVVKVAEHFVQVMKVSLTNDGPSQLPSFVTKLPRGDEKGVYFAVDLGGTNCRVCSVTLHGDSTYTLLQSKHAVPSSLRINANYEPLFDFIAERIQEFRGAHPETRQQDPNELEHVLPAVNEKRRQHFQKLGFTFSFTCEQHSLTRGTLLHWDKGWNIPSALGKDPCAMLQEAIDRIDMPIVVSALANDSVGTLMTRSYSSQEKSRPLLGAIFGTGTNAAYIERLSNCTKLHNQAEFQDFGSDDRMLINTEWGCFDNSLEVLPSTKYDHLLDKMSDQPGDQMLEKRVSGLYLGELLRLAVLDLVQGGLFDMTVDSSSPLFQPGTLDSSVLTALAEDDSEHFNRSQSFLGKLLAAGGVSEADAHAIRLVSIAIAHRAARLAGASIAAIIIQTQVLQPRSPVSTPMKASIGEEIHPYSSTSKSATQDFLQLFRRFICKPFKLLSLCGLLGKSRTPPSLSSDHRVVQNGNLGEDVIDIGVDGSLIEFYPTFQQDIREALREVPDIGVEGEQKVRIGLVEHASAVGAALMAQAAQV